MMHMNPEHARGAKQAATDLRMLHIVPEDGIGGVEIAACLAAERLGGRLRVHFLKPRAPDAQAGHISCGRSANALALGNAKAAIESARAFDPDVIVFSLWKSVIAFVMMRLVLRKPKFVFFIHSDRSSHIVDRLATAIMARWSDAVWADSDSALRGRLGRHRDRYRTRIISFILYRPAGEGRDAPGPVFAYWGRLNRIKGIDKAIDLFRRITAAAPAARFIIIGPDSGIRGELEAQVQRLGLDGRVEFAGAMTMPDIQAETAHASFYVQLSSQEGVAMSVIEAMQSGLVPVVTPVGAIADYCRDGENAVIYTDAETTSTRILDLLGDEDAFRRMSRAAASQWARSPLYHDDLVDAAQSVMRAAA
jgi:glycosyltransferase involved in cell wall biosynthesis